MHQTTFSDSSEVKNIFERIAPVYDDLNDWLSFGQHRIWKMMTVKWCEPKLGDTALDLCCGSGDLALMLAKRVGATGKVIGLDFACQQLAIAKQKQQLQSAALSVEWLEGDALNLPFADNYFDCVTVGYGLRNVNNIPLCLQELQRVLKPGAKAAILDFHRPREGFMRSFQQWYLDNIVVPTAQRFGLTEEYAYLTPSLAKFPNSQEQLLLAQNAGFTLATYYSLAGGMMGVLVLGK